MLWLWLWLFLTQLVLHNVFCTLIVILNVQMSSSAYDTCLREDLNLS